MRVLVTGFGPFRGVRSNPTEALSRGADGRRIGRAEVVGHVLPTEFRRCEKALLRSLREVRPDAIVMFGTARRIRRLHVEALALNVDHSEEPDNAGVRRWRRPIRKGAPKVVEARVPVDRIYRALRRARIPAAVSHHAGTYVCNHAFYVAAASAPRARVGFVHVPRGWKQDRLRRAVEIIVRALG